MLLSGAFVQEQREDLEYDHHALADADPSRQLEDRADRSAQVSAASCEDVRFDPETEVILRNLLVSWFDDRHKSEEV